MSAMDLRVFLLFFCLLTLTWALPSSSLFEDQLFLEESQQQQQTTTPATTIADHFQLSDVNSTDSILQFNETTNSSKNEDASLFSLLDFNSTIEQTVNTTTTATEENVTKSVIDMLMDLNVTEDGDDVVVTRPTVKENATDDAVLTEFGGNVDGLNKQSDKSFLIQQDFVTSPSTTTRSPLAESHADTDNRESILTFHPQNATSSTSKSPFISFNTSSTSNDWQSYVDDLEAFLEPYSKDNQQTNVHCDFERQLSQGEACRFDLVYLGPSCTKRNHFGYSIGKPCVILSPAKIQNWVPAAYDNETTDIPDEVQRLMRIFNANFMFITCDGMTEADRKAIGPMAYLPPYQGFPSYFFPYQTTTNYLPPLMAIEFLNPANSTRIDVICKAWANNLNDQPHKTTLKFSLQVN
ncbi:ATPase, Na K transporting, beta [Chamberlinius hualienensis]